MIVTFVVAVAENGVIGRNGQLPWRMPTDMKRFRTLTLGRPVIMGRRTFESLRKPLEDRDNIVVTRRTDFRTPPGVHVAPGIQEALALARPLAVARGADEIAVIGGAEVFRAALPFADRIYLTIVRGDPEGDTRLEPFDPKVWQESSRETLPQTADDQYPADFAVLNRRS
jgi:dihydrofolate reductase